MNKRGQLMLMSSVGTGDVVPMGTSVVSSQKVAGKQSISRPPSLSTMNRVPQTAFVPSGRSPFNPYVELGTKASGVVGLDPPD